VIGDEGGLLSSKPLCEIPKSTFNRMKLWDSQDTSIHLEEGISTIE
jgi:hypothetical protein